MRSKKQLLLLSSVAEDVSAKCSLIEYFGKQFKRFYQFLGLAPRAGIITEQQLEVFAKQYSEVFNVPKVFFNNWHEALSALAKETAKEETLILLDEIAWLSANDLDFAGTLKIIWDTKFHKNSKLILVLC